MIARAEYIFRNSRTTTGIQGSCPRATCTVYILLAIAQLSQAQFTTVRDGIVREYATRSHDGAFVSLQAYADDLIYPPKGADMPASTYPHSTSLNLSRMKRKASEELPVRDKNARFSPDQTSEGSTAASLQLTLSQLEEMIKISDVWRKQHKMLSVFLTASSPAQPPRWSTAPSFPSPNRDLGSSLPSDTTIPCTFPDDDATSSFPDSDPGDSKRPMASSSIIPSPKTDPSNISSSISEPISQLSSKDQHGVRVRTLGTVYDRGKGLSALQARSTPHNQKSSKARALSQSFQEAGLDPETATETRRQIRQQARDAGMHAEFQAFLSQPKIASRRKPLELKCSDQR